MVKMAQVFQAFNLEKPIVEIAGFFSASKELCLFCRVETLTW
jgi:hypothetical protein